MDQREIELVRAICHEVDILVTRDPGASNLDALEKARLEMNDYLWKKRYREAESKAYDILMMHFGS
ncbi:MAG: hypothetical protein ABR913_05055 [Sedimentisphaerales bacterium]|jgi:hypothetical protein